MDIFPLALKPYLSCVQFQAIFSVDHVLWLFSQVPRIWGQKMIPEKHQKHYILTHAEMTLYNFILQCKRFNLIENKASLESSHFRYQTLKL